MRHFSALVASLGAVMVLALASPALAGTKPVEQVIGACDALADKDPSKCGYSSGDNGDITGCFSGGQCFYCPADGSRQCTMLFEGTRGPKVGGVLGLGTRPGVLTR